MNWKRDLKLSDLDARTLLEATCKRCGYSRYERQCELIKRPEFRDAYLDEVESALSCTKRGCDGFIRIALIHDDKMEGFIGGMP